MKWNNTYSDDSLAIGIRIPRLFVNLQAAFGRHQADERRHFAGKMVDLVRVLAGLVLAAQQRVIGEGLILQHFDTFTAAGVILGCFSN